MLNGIVSLIGGVLITTLYGAIMSPYERAADATAPQEVVLRMDRAHEEEGSARPFMEKATELYAEGIEYEWPAHKARVDVADNWILWAMAWLDPLLVRANLTNVEGLFSAYESISWERALGRGYGICSQNALGFADLLSSRYGIEADVIGLQGHVVVEAQGLLLDPSVGLMVPMDVEEAEEREESRKGVTQLYEQAFPEGGTTRTCDVRRNLVNETRFSELGQFDDAVGNQRIDGVKGYRPKIYYLERASEWLKWGIPAILLLIGVGGLLRARRTT